MIYDKLALSERYDEVSPRIGQLLRYLRSHDLSSFDDGKVVLDGDNLFFTISTNQTKDPDVAKPEIHKNYIDLQYLIEGEETFGVAFITDDTVLFEENPAKDVYFYRGEMIPLTLGNDSFCLVFPGEIHQPGVHPASGPQKVRKLVGKIRVD